MNSSDPAACSDSSGSAVLLQQPQFLGFAVITHFRLLPHSCDPHSPVGGSAELPREECCVDGGSEIAKEMSLTVPEGSS